MKCPQCDSEVSPHKVICKVCQRHLGFPNVRAAEEPAEQAGLQQRYDKAKAEAAVRGAESELADFEQSVDASHAVMSKRWGTVCQVVGDRGELFKTFYRQVKEDDREPQDNGFDQQRQAVDTMFFPLYSEEIKFAALSLNGRGPESYGECHFTLRSKTISERTSLFEENTLVFSRRHNVSVTEGPEPGFRSTWESRRLLAAAKLGAVIEASTAPDDYPNILLKQTGETDTDDFVEVHIHGTLNEQCVESYRLPKPKDKEEKVIRQSLTKKLKKAGATERKD